MAVTVESKDCTNLSDAEIAEIADLCAESPARYEIGELTKLTEAWVLVSQIREGRRLKAFAFSTLERIGGTPCILIGLASVRRSSKRDAHLRALMGEQFRRAVLAFPHEDVVVGVRMRDAAGFEAFKTLEDIVPRPGHSASGEERAWGRRLAKRFGIENGDYNDRTFITKGDKSYPLCLDHESLKPEAVDEDVAAMFKTVNAKRGDTLVAFGWAMAEDLAKLA
jgi:hypothetical protein